MSNILVTGSAAGLGLAIVRALAAEGHRVYGYDIANADDVTCPEMSLTWGGRPPADLDILINNAGLNRSDWLEDATEADWDAVMGVNAKGIFKMTQWALDVLAKRGGTVLNIVSNAAHVPMRTSLAYNASKGAAHIMTLQLARELGPRHGITVFGIAPNKLAGTPMSRGVERRVLETRGWSEEFARQYQLNALPAGEETDPEALAEFVAFLLKDKRRHKYLAGCVLPYGT